MRKAVVQSGKASNSPVRLGRGMRLGKYRLVKRLGRGGYGTVWKARDTVEGIWVALKIPHVKADGQTDNQALLREVRLVAGLRHEHLMPVKNADIIKGYAVLATELSVGTLADRCKPMAPRRLVGIIGQVLEGLAHAHRHRVVHCDVTPGNIFLFPDGRAALGDFGISLQYTGRMGTVDEFGTPGYVAPEQAYGKPTYASDCFAVGLILYEYLTGYLPRWPFRWPFRGHERLRERTSAQMVRFLQKALRVDPNQRFGRADVMLTALLESVPRPMRPCLEGVRLRPPRTRWTIQRRQAFVKRYARILGPLSRCVDCGEPIAECMQICPWCRSERNRFDTRSRYDYVCPRCHRGVLAEWRYCPWCYGPGFASPSERRTPGVHYHSRCRYCGGGLQRFMRYCPWCRRKVRRAWKVKVFPEVCTSCGGPVDSEFWHYCPWCRRGLI